MENASKALIIAGAILLSILIIALGMRIFNSASSSAEGANLDAQELSAHNSKFEAYAGLQKGSQVTALINAIQKNNKEYEDRKISISISETTSERIKETKVKTDAASAKLDNAVLYYYTDPVTKTTGVNNPIEDDSYTTARGKLISSTTYSVNFFYDESTGLLYFVSIHLP